MLNHKKRQAAYAAKNRRKAKALRRPDARAVAEAYRSVVENGPLERMLQIYFSKLTPDADAAARSREVVELVRNLVPIALHDSGYDYQQAKDKLASMSATRELEGRDKS
jgi:hypothetical protein